MKPGTVNELEREWAAANPRPHWTSDFWAACRPEHDEVQGDPTMPYDQSEDG